MNELKPCPFCGRGCYIENSDDGKDFRVRCYSPINSHCLGRWEESPNAAAAIWNRRDETLRAVLCRYYDICTERSYRAGVIDDYWFGKSHAINEIISTMNRRAGERKEEKSEL